MIKAVTTSAEYSSIMGGATILPKGEEWYQGFLVEIVLTAILAQTVLCCAVDTKDNALAPLAIGLTVALDIFGAGSISGASMNPARSFGPCVAAALFTGVKDKSIIWITHYIYWAGPLIGAAISAFLYR
jgi:glycerol uptake facilitator-like aquaporin